MSTPGSSSRPSPGGCHLRGPRPGTGAAQAEKCGSVRMFSPAICTSRVECPIQVTRPLGAPEWIRSRSGGTGDRSALGGAGSPCLRRSRFQRRRSRRPGRPCGYLLRKTGPDARRMLRDRLACCFVTALVIPGCNAWSLPAGGFVCSCCSPVRERTAEKGPAPGPCAWRSLAVHRPIMTAVSHLFISRIVPCRLSR